MTDTTGSVAVNISDSIIQFYNRTQDIGNRTVIVHAMSDDLGTGGIPASNTTG
jgi:Cu/Zn superoxide dismutase